MATRKDAKTGLKIAVFIRKQREKRFPGWGGKTAAANAFGVNQSLWGKWESGKSVPDDPNQRALAEFFGVTIGQLRGDHEKPSAEAEGLRVIDDLESTETLVKDASLLLSVLAKALGEAARHHLHPKSATLAVRAALQGFSDALESIPASQDDTPSAPASPTTDRP